METFGDLDRLKPSMSAPWNSSAPALAVFVKTPGLSPVKTRLAAVWGEKKTLEFYEHCLRCSGELMRRLQTDGWDAGWAVAVADGLRDLRWSEFPAISQGESGLGGRIARVIRELRKHRPTAFVIGSDSPQLRPDHLKQAHTLLERSDVVVGPADDGGFWLLGSRVDLPEKMMESVAYSEPGTRLELIRTLRKWNPDLLIGDSLPLLQDVDVEEDAKALIPELGLETSQRELAKWLTHHFRPR